MKNPLNAKVSGLRHAKIAQLSMSSRKIARKSAEKKAKKAQIIKRIFSIFNLKVLIMAVTQVFLNDLGGAGITLGILLLMIVLNEVKHTRTTRQVGKLLIAARPKATVFREGRFINIDLDDVVIGDVLLVGSGDEILADGIILESDQFSVDLSLQTPAQELARNRTVDRVSAGSFCETGWAMYRVDHIPEEIDLDEISTVAAPSIEVRTPLQKGIQALLLVLLAVAGVFYTILIIELFRFEVVPPELVSIYRQAISIIFSIAPTGLLFMVVLNYAVGSAKIAKQGALIKGSHSMEVLSQVTNLLLIRKKDLSSHTLKIEMIPDQLGEFLFTETRTRQLLANYIHSMPSVQYPFSVIKGDLEGQCYPLKREARFFSALGWDAINFDSDDMPGTYVVGYPEVLQNHLSNLQACPETIDNQGSEKTLPFDLQKRWHRLTQPFKKHILQQENQSAEPVLKQPKNESDESLRLLFAYSPDLLSQQSTYSQPPQGLIPICFIELIKVDHPEMKTAFQAIKDAGIALKIMSSGRVENINGLARLFEFEDHNLLKSSVVSGQSFSLSDYEKSVFFQLNSGQMLSVIENLKKHGEVVALQSGLVTDIPLMSQSDISITTIGSSQKLLATSDVILTNNSPTILPRIFKMSQNIVQNVINLLKLNLTKIAYVLILIIAMFLTGNRRFIYEPIHGTVIGIFTIALPSVFISLWTNSLKSKREGISKQLALFIIPASVTIALVIIGTFFFYQARGFLFFRIQHLVTHLLVLIGLALVVFCYPPTPSRNVFKNGTTTRDWRMTGVALALFGGFHLLTIIPAFQMPLRLVPLVSPMDYLIIWTIGLGWGLLTQFVWYVIQRMTTLKNLKP